MAVTDERADRCQPWGYEDEYDPQPCTNPRGHSFVCSDENEEISYCEWCGADGNG